MARSRNFAPTEAEAGPIVDDEVGRLFDSTQARAAQPRVRDLPVERIDPNPFQARREFTDIDELAQTMRVQGFTSRLRVRPHPDQAGRFQLVYGERRLRAAITADLTRIPVEIVGHSDDEMVEIGLAENIQRRDLQPMEEAIALESLMRARGYSQRALADRLGKSTGYVQNRLDLLRAPEDVQDLVRQRPESLQAARSIARLSDPAQRKPLIAGLVSGALTGDDVVVRVREQLTHPAADDVPAPVPLTDVPTGRSAVALPTTNHHVPAPEMTPGQSPVGSPPPERVAGRQGAGGSAMARILESDVKKVDVLLSRWRQALRRATDEERRAFAAYLRDHLEPQLHALRQSVEGDDVSTDPDVVGRV